MGLGQQATNSLRRAKSSSAVNLRLFIGSLVLEEVEFLGHIYLIKTNPSYLNIKLPNKTKAIIQNNSNIT